MIQQTSNRSARVLAFEPESSYYALINRNIQLNQMSAGVEAYCIALSEKTILDSLNIGAFGNSFGVETNQFDKPIETRFRQAAVGLSVDDFVRTFAPPLPTHVKIDVDGLEPDILRGAKYTFAMPCVQSMIIEVEKNPSSTRDLEIFKLMEDLGFTAQPKKSIDYRNVIFERT